jgi:hypothetical protein
LPSYNPEYYRKNRDRILQQNRNSYRRHKDKRRAHHIEYNQKVRLEALKHYSGGKLECACCGEKHIEFLSIDHIDGGGSKHRREGGGLQIAFTLRKLDYPDGYRVLCHNCNMSLGFYGYCPHKKEI